MHIIVRLAVAGYIVALSLALLAGNWPLQGPMLFSVIEGRGLHVGDTGVLLVSALLAGAVLTGRPGRWPDGSTVVAARTVAKRE